MGPPPASAATPPDAGRSRGNPESGCAKASPPVGGTRDPRASSDDRRHLPAAGRRNRTPERIRWLDLRASRHVRSEEHTSELQSLAYLVCRLLLEKKKR